MNRILKLALIGTVLLLAGLALASPPVALADPGQVVSDVHFHPGTSSRLVIRAP